MHILHLSDTHAKHRELPPLLPADVIIHTGDFTQSATNAEALDFLTWFAGLPYKYKILISGNHDPLNISNIPKTVHYLSDSGVEIEGIRFWGAAIDYNAIPANTDVLLTHIPPYGICDQADYGKGLTSHGDRVLRERVEQLHLKLHLFGHEHDAYGVMKLGETVFSNASVLDSKFNMVGTGRLLEI